MIANVSPAIANVADTLSTLRFAQRVKAIQNTVRYRTAFHAFPVFVTCNVRMQTKHFFDDVRSAVKGFSVK